MQLAAGAVNVEPCVIVTDDLTVHLNLVKSFSDWWVALLSMNGTSATERKYLAYTL